MHPEGGWTKLDTTRAQGGDRGTDESERSARTIGLCGQGKGGFVQLAMQRRADKNPVGRIFDRNADAHGRRDRQTGAFCPIAVLSEQTGPARILNHECQGRTPESSLELVHPSTDEDQ